VEYTGGGEPDLPAKAGGVLPGYFNYPANPVDQITAAPAAGGEITALVASGGAVLEMSKNHLWQQLNKELGATLKINTAPSGDMASKVATTIAGGDLPDFMMLTSSTMPPNLPQVLEAKFQDLTEFLSGDAVKQYPNLAAIPSISWKNCVFNKKLYATAVPFAVTGSVLTIRRDIPEAADVPDTITSGQDLLDVCKQFVGKSRTKWAFFQAPTALLSLVAQMTGAPNTWRVESGTFTSQWGTPELQDAISKLTAMWNAGYFNPDAFTGLGTGNDLVGGNYLFGYTSALGWQSYINRLVGTKGAVVGCFVLPKWDGGGQSKQRLGPGLSNITVIKKGSKARVEELLRVANYLSAPFGTQEYLLMEYGVKDIGYTLEGTNPILTDVGNNELRIAEYYIGRALLPLYSAGNPDAVRAQYEFASAVVPDGEPLPTVGLYSETDLQKGTSLTKNLTDTVGDIIQGRKKLSQWTDAVSAWRKAGGDQIAKEYAASYAAVNG
jgi:putative aldouronate transport system substrate-binding protein